MAKTGRTNRRKCSLPKLIDRYYADLAAFAQHNVLFEMGTRPALHALLAAAGKEHTGALQGSQRPLHSHVSADRNGLRFTAFRGCAS
jgi:hypothetical protein